MTGRRDPSPSARLRMTGRRDPSPSPRLRMTGRRNRRLDKLAELAESKQTIYTDLKVVDIAGLVRGASKGEGLGNQFLANIRETDAILHVVRCFEDPNVVHVEHGIDPAR